jgi:hypothetical protein
MLAQADQAASAIEEFGRILGAYRRSLVKEGIPEDNANYLVHAYAEAYWDRALHHCCPCQAPPSLTD